MNNNPIQKKHAPKQNGITGRSSNSDIQKRIETGASLLVKFDFKNKKEFIRKYKNALKKNDMQVPAEQTISNDIKKMEEHLVEKGILINKNTKTINFQHTDDSIKGKIRHVKISVNGHENTLYDEQYKDCLKSYKEFKAPFLRLYKRNAITLVRSDPPVRHFPMVHLYIITCDESKKNYNTELSTKILKQFLVYVSQEILYVSAHHNCAEIVFYKKNYDLILFHTFCLIKFACS